MAVENRVRKPNREKAANRLTKWLVVAGLVATVVLSVVLALGGWDTMQGAKVLFVLLVALDVVFAVFVVFWNRGVLPVIIAFATMYGIFAGVSGPQWFARDKGGLTNPALDEPMLGLLCLIIAGVQVVLIVLAAIAFTQKWQVEEVEKVDVATPARGGQAGAGAPDRRLRRARVVGDPHYDPHVPRRGDHPARVVER